MLHRVQSLHGFLPFLTKDNFNQLEVLSSHQAISTQYKPCCVLPTKHALAWLSNSQYEGRQLAYSKGKRQNSFMVSSVTTISFTDDCTWVMRTIPRR